MACPGRKNLYEAKVQIKHYTLLHYTHNRIPKRVFKQDVVNPFFSKIPVTFPSTYLKRGKHLLGGSGHAFNIWYSDSSKTRQATWQTRLTVVRLHRHVGTGQK